MHHAQKYLSLYERLVANTYLAIPDDPSSCWIWKGPFGSGGYPLISIRIPGKKNPISRLAHRVMLEEYHDIVFPFDEAGHNCNDPRCINPNHLEVQTRAMNCIMRPGYRIGKKTREACLIPVLFPRGELQDDDVPFEPRAVDVREPVAADCPF